MRWIRTFTLVGMELTEKKDFVKGVILEFINEEDEFDNVSVFVKTDEAGVEILKKYCIKHTLIEVEDV